MDASMPEDGDPLLRKPSTAVPRWNGSEGIGLTPRREPHLGRARVSVATSNPDVLVDTGEHRIGEPTRVSIIEPHPDRDAQLWPVVAEVDGLRSAGRISEAVARASAALADRPAAGDAEIELKMALAPLLWVGGRAREAVSLLDSVFGHPQLRHATRVAAEQLRLLALLADGQIERARHTAEALLAGGACTGDAALPGGLEALALLTWHEGRMGDAIGFLRAAAQRAESASQPSRWPYTRVALARAQLAMGQFDEARVNLERARHDIDRAGAHEFACVLPIMHGLHALATGQPSRAEAAATEGVALVTRAGADLFAPLGLAAAAGVSLHVGDLREARLRLSALRSVPVPRSGIGFVDRTWIEARLWAAQGGPVAAMEVAAGLYNDPNGHHRLLVEETGSGPWFVRTALLAGDRPRAEAVAATLALLASINRGVPCVAAAMAHARGLLEEDPWRCEKAAGAYVHPWTRATAAEDAGMIEARAGTSRAPRLLEAAAARYDAIGARYDVARVRSVLQGVPKRGGRPIVTGWRSLTDGERRIARAVAEGLTNAEVGGRLFLSRHTVDFHLRNIYRKLDVRSRVQLTRLVLADDH